VKKIVLLAFVSMFFLSAMLPFIEESTSFSGTTLHVDPSTNSVLVGNTFVINVVVADVADLSGFGFTLGYNTTILDALGAWVPKPFEPPIIIELQDGYVIVTATSPIPLSGSATLASITFNATAVGSSILNLYNTTLLDSAGDPIPHTTIDGSVKASSAITVPDHYPTIQEAINAASDGDTIFVRADTYYEHLTISKSISLLGEDRATTIIDGNGTGGWGYKDSVVYVTADNVFINGFTIRNSGGSGYWSLVSGICLVSSNNKIVGNNIMNNNYGIILGALYSSPNIASLENTIISNAVQNNNYGIFAHGDNAHNLIANNTVTDNPSCGIWFGGLRGNDSNTLTGNIVSNSQTGIGLVGWILIGGTTSSDFHHNILQPSSESPFPPLSNNTVSSNIVTSCEYGIAIDVDTELCNGNTVITSNTITSNNVGLSLGRIDGMYSFNNTVYHNNFISNQLQVFLSNSVDNIWDDGYPSGGNYWSDYNGTDMNQDGIGDTSYGIDVNNTDHYPLVGMFSDFSVTHQEETYHVTTVCNSTISEFRFNDVAETISFNVSGKDGTLGFCRVGIPNIVILDLWQGNYTVLVDGEQPLATRNWTDGTYTYIYFTYQHSEHKVEIISEFPTWTSMLLILIVLMVVVVIYKRRLLKTPIH
jgi:parallel beta-helix repeat protein